jgi:ribokinase
VHATEGWELPGGGGAVAAVQLARLVGECLFITALADDALGRGARAELEKLGVRVAAAPRPAPQRRAFVHVDSGGERTITVIGDRVGPHAADDLPWDELAACDAVYLTAGDAGAVRRARAAGTLVATSRAIEALAEAAVQLDALVSSASDAGERYEAGGLDPEPALVVRTEGAAGGSVTAADGAETRWEAAPLPGPAVDFYGAGDTFAAALAYGLAAGPLEDALALAARSAARSITGRGPYEARVAR